MRRVVRHIWLVGGLLVLLASEAGALSVSATVDRNTAAVGQQIVVTVAIQSNESVDVEMPPAPVVSNARVSGPQGPSTSQQISIVNGRTSRQYTARYSYVVIPEKPGQTAFPELEVRVDGRRHLTSAIQLTITEGSGQGASSERLIWIRTDLSKTRVYQGEEVVVTYLLYEKAGARIGNRQITATPEHTGFWVETHVDARQDEVSRREQVINGVPHTVMTILQQSLFPTSSGTFQIPSMGLSAVIEEPTDRVDFFGRRYYRQRPVNVSSVVRELEVLPLPTGAPPEFSGAVGQYSLEASVDRTEVSRGDPVTWRITLSGQGNIRSVGELDIPGMPDFRSYDPKVTTRIDGFDGTFSGRKVYEIVLIPLHAGMLEIPQVSFTYFDPQSEQYRTARTERSMLAVNPGEGDEALTAGPIGSGQAAIRQVGSDIRFIHGDLERLEDQTATVFDRPWYWLLQALPVAILLGSIGVRWRRERLAGDQWRVRSMASRGLARKKLKAARELQKKGDLAGMTAALATAIAELVAGHGGGSAAGVTSEQIRDTLETAGAPGELIEQTLEVVERCDRVRYAPSLLSEETAEELYQAGEEALGGLFRYLRK